MTAPPLFFLSGPAPAPPPPPTGSGAFVPAVLFSLLGGQPAGTPPTPARCEFGPPRVAWFMLGASPPPPYAGPTYLVAAAVPQPGAFGFASVVPYTGEADPRFTNQTPI